MENERTRIEIAYNRFKMNLEMFGFTIDKPIEWFVIFSKNTQAQMLFWHLKQFGYITNQQAQQIYGISHCPTPIKALRDMFIKEKMPYKIINEHIDGVNRWGKKSKYDEYTLEEVKC